MSLEPEDTPPASPDTAAREALILDPPLRIAPLDRKGFSDDVLALVGKMRQIGSRRPPPTSMDEVPDVLAVMLRHAELYQVYVDLGIQLGLRGVIPFRDRELCILRTAWLCQAPYEWGEHVKKGHQAGLTTEEVERVTQGSKAPGWEAHDRALLTAVEELHADAMISDATWAALTERYDDKQMIELPILIGHYQGTAFSQNSLRLKLNPGTPGLNAR